MARSRWAASLAVALVTGGGGCGESEADRIGDELVESVKKTDGGELTEVTCERSEGSEYVWYCDGEYRSDSLVIDDTRYRVNLDNDKSVEAWSVTEP